MTLLRHFLYNKYKNNETIKYSKSYPPYFKAYDMVVSKQFFVLVVRSKLSLGRTFENEISLVTSLIYQYKPNYRP